MRRSATFAIFNFSPNNTVTHWGLISQIMASRFSKTTSCHDVLDQHFHFYIPFNLEISFWCVDNSHFTRRLMSPFWLRPLSNSFTNLSFFLKDLQLTFLYIGWDAHNRSSGHTFVFQLFWQTLSHHRIVIRCTFLTKSSFTEPTSHEGSKFPKHWPVKFAAEFRTEPLRRGDRWPTSADIRVSLGALPCRESALRWVGPTFLIFHPF